MRTRCTGVSSTFAGASAFASDGTLSISDMIGSVSDSEATTSGSGGFASADLDALTGAFLLVVLALAGGLDVETARPFRLVLGAGASSTISAFASSSPESDCSGLVPDGTSTAPFFDRARETVRGLLPDALKNGHRVLDLVSRFLCSPLSWMGHLMSRGENFMYPHWIIVRVPSTQ